MSKKHSPLSGVDPVELQAVTPIQEESCPKLLMRDNYDREDDDDESDEEDEAFQDLSFDPPDDPSIISDLEYQELCQKDTVRTCLEGQYGIFNNLPSPSVHNVGGHACMKIGDVIAQHMAQGCGFEFTETPSKCPGENPSRIYTGIRGILEWMSSLIL